TSLRTQHIALDHRFRCINKSEYPRCLHCPAGIKETVPHFLIEYSQHQRGRHLLQNVLLVGRDALSIPHLLTDTRVKILAPG
ncbi:hypothetical protein EDD22DRAFT_784749, partial [Suillus occidentalis]